MAREYTKHDINGTVHELHPVKVDGRKIGFVPVRDIKTLQDAEDWAHDSASSFDEELLVGCLKYGATVHLQRLARESVTGEKFTDAAFNKMFCILPKDELVAFHGNAAGLRDRLKELWVEKQTTMDDIAEDTVHEEIH